MPNSIRLPLPGPVEENGDVTFVAPTGAEVDAFQEDNATWSVLWSHPEMAETFEYGDGPGGADWDNVTIGGEMVWMDHAGERWLSRHLVLEERAPLSDAAMDMARRDYLAAEALDAAEAAYATLLACAQHAPAPDGQRASPTAELAALALSVRELARQQARQLEAAWAMALAAEPERAPADAEIDD